MTFVLMEQLKESNNMPIYAYEGHMGGIYFSQFEYDLDDLYCEQCGDYDWLIGEACNAKDMIAKLSDYLAVDSYESGYNFVEVLADMKKYFDDIPSLEEAKEIVRSTRKEDEDE